MTKKILFICHGNICRSPMAEMIFKKMLADRGLSADFTVRSSATSTEALGEGIYPPALRELARHGVPTEARRAVQLKRSDYGEYDLFLCMDGKNIRNINMIFGGDPDGKVMRLLDLTDRGGDVSDPWYTGDFTAAYEDIRRGCEALLEYLYNMQKM